MREFTVYAAAKLNLYLDVLDKRPDGYHNLKTLFEKIDLKDEIIIREKGKGIDVLVASPAACPSGKDNIVYKALQALFREANVDLGVEVVIKKRIPVAAGLGGGSSDAASVIRSVNERFNLGLSSDRLFSIAFQTGKDVPFFMLDAPFAIGTDQGERLEIVDVDGSCTHIVVKPDISISTAEMYKRLDNHAHVKAVPDIKEVVSALRKQDLQLLRKSHYNIFEEILADYSFYIEKAKNLLSKAGAGPVFLSGSGPSVFCTLKDREDAAEILRKIPEEKGVEIFLATTYKGGIYGNNRG